ncbi:hypothetical protein COOONC_11884 [Cooperia oncophora]
MNVELIRNTLYKAYIEDFYRFCKKLGGTTAEVMCEILAFEADRRSIIITINSFDTELSKDDREKLYPRCGKLYPEGEFTYYIFFLYCAEQEMRNIIWIAECISQRHRTKIDNYIPIL